MSWAILLAPPSAGVPATIEALCEAGWTEAVDAAVAHGVASLFAFRLRELGVWQHLAEPQQATLRRIEIFDAMAELRRRNCLAHVLDALHGASIVPIPHKGAVLAYGTYPSPPTRRMTDIDLWVDPREMTRAVEALKSIGFTLAPCPDARPAALEALLEGEVKLRHTEFGTVELHWGFFAGFWLDVASRIDRAALMARATPASLLGRGVRLLAPRDHLVVVATHAAISNRHHLAALRGLLDIVLIADAIDDWRAPMEDWRRWRIARLMAHCLQLAGELFERPRLLEISRELQRETPIRLLLRHADKRKVLDAGRAFGSLERWGFLVCAADGTREALRLCGRAAWPSRAWIEARYGRSGIAQRLKHLAKSARADFD